MGYQYVYSSGTPGCQDSNATSKGIAYLYARTFAKEVFNTANNNKLKLDTRIFNGGPNTSVIYAYGFARKSTFIGCTCQNLGVAPLGMVMVPGKTGGTGYGVNRYAIPYAKNMAGARLYMQVAWNDTKTGQLMLTRQSLTGLQAQPVGKMRCLSQAGTEKPRLDMAMQRIPLTRYVFK